jgi:hypothetical protein
LNHLNGQKKNKNSQHNIHEFSKFFLELAQTQIKNQGLSAICFQKFHGSFYSSITSTFHLPINIDNIYVNLSLLSIKDSSDLESCLEKFILNITI